MVVAEYDSDIINKVDHRNIALSRIAYGRGEVDIDVIARSFDMDIFAYNAEVQNTINHCVETGTSFINLRGNT